jgi:hypothetical protein
MQLKLTNIRPGLIFLIAAALLLPNANAASCRTQSQMTATERDAVSNTARTMIGQVQT